MKKLIALGLLSLLAHSAAVRSEDCSQTGPCSCLEAFYSRNGNQVVECGNPPTIRCMPEERDVKFQGPVAVPVGWHTLPLTGTMKVAKFRKATCVYDAGTGQATCIYMGVWDEVQCYDNRDPLGHRDCP